MVTETSNKIRPSVANPVVTAALQKLGEALYMHNAMAEESESVVESIDYLASCGFLE